ncbi:hypothetical protein C1X55_31960, partial [Pseudomonas sp. GW460-C8]
SHRVWSATQNLRLMKIKNVGASLLAIASSQSTSISADTPPSRAGSLPQWGLWWPFSSWGLRVVAAGRS